VDSAVFDRRETTRLGSFEIIRKLARGGMAEIFLARTRGPSGFEKLVVLKKILPKYAGKRRFVQLFLEEAKLAAGLDHPNIAQVYDIGMVDGSYFFTMEYLHGQDLRSILHRAWRTGERIPIENAVQIARNVASALHFAHEKRGSDGALLGIVHRDVSPSNVIVTYDGATKLLDFGVAKTTTSTVKTRTGALKGKVSYMSPEQARGAPIDRRSDIFSLGVVLWETVTVQRLFRGENDLATLQLIINQPPKRPTAIRPDCPQELERIVLRALAQDPADRYPTAEHLVTELEELAREHKLKQSSSALSATVAQLFTAELAAWRAARAAGVPLADHLNDISDHTAPVHESDFIQLDGSADDEDDDLVIERGDAHDDDLAIAHSDEPSEAHALGPDDGKISQHELEQLGQLYHRDEPDDDDDDDEKTEHVPLFVEPLPPLSPGSRATPNAPFPPVAGSKSTPSPQFPPGASLPVLAIGPAPGSPATLIGPFTAMSDPPDSADAPTAILGPVTPLSGSPAQLGGLPTQLGGPATQLGGPPTQLGGPATLITGPGTQPGAPGSILPTQPASPPPVIGTRTTPLPFSGGPGASPFTVPPWQSGQPGGPPTERIQRSWAVIDLPAFDPEVYERHRRIVLRVASGVLALVLLIAIVVGRC
jgi:serine/threonine protein kinase